MFQYLKLFVRVRMLWELWNGNVLVEHWGEQLLHQ